MFCQLASIWVSNQLFKDAPTPDSCFVNLSSFQTTKNCLLRRDSHSDRQSKGEHADHHGLTLLHG